MAEGLNNKQSGDANIAFITLPGDMWWWCYHVELIMKLLNPPTYTGAAAWSVFLTGHWLQTAGPDSWSRQLVV